MCAQRSAQPRPLQQCKQAVRAGGHTCSSPSACRSSLATPGAPSLPSTPPCSCLAAAMLSPASATPHPLPLPPPTRPAPPARGPTSATLPAAALSTAPAACALHLTDTWPSRMTTSSVARSSAASARAPTSPSACLHTGRATSAGPCTGLSGVVSAVSAATARTPSCGGSETVKGAPSGTSAWPGVNTATGRPAAHSYLESYHHASAAAAAVQVRLRLRWCSLSHQQAGGCTVPLPQCQARTRAATPALVLQRLRDSQPQ